MRSALLALLLVAGSSSAPENPQRPRSNDRPAEQAKPAERPAEPTPLTVTVVTAPPTAEERDRQREQGAAEEQNRRRLFWLGFAQWSAAAAAVGVGFFQAWLLKKQRDISAEQTALAREQNAIASQQARILESQLAAERAVQRGYATMSHHSPGIEEAGRDPLRLRVRIEVRNSGNSPATLSSIGVDFKFNRGVLPPGGPPKVLRFVRPAATVVVKDDWFTWSEVLTIPDYQNFAAFRDGAMKDGWDFYLLAYVDYRDAFGGRFRRLYARKYEPLVDDTDRYRLVTTPGESNMHAILRGRREGWAERNNLAFVLDPGYNDERVREPGEGNDWPD